MTINHPKKKTKLGFQAGGVRSNCKHVILKGNAVWFVIRRGYSAKGYAGRVLGDVRKQSICMMKSRVSSRTCYQTLHLSSSNSFIFIFQDPFNFAQLQTSPNCPGKSLGPSGCSCLHLIDPWFRCRFSHGLADEFAGEHPKSCLLRAYR